MADRFWVGGSANWDGTAGTKWATTSGGAGGASVPTSADDVYFNAASGAVTVTVAASVNCLSLNCTGFTGTITGTSTINVYANTTLASGMTWSHTGNFVFQATSGSYTVASAGKTFGAGLIFGVLGASTATWTLQDALAATANITHTSGTFTTNNYAVTAPSLSSSNSNTRTINLGSSTVTLTLGAPVTFTTSTNLTFNAGTSNIICSSTSGTLNGGSQVFYNVSFTSTSISLFAITGANTFNNFTVTAPSSAGVAPITFDSRQTINGTLSTTGTAGNRRVWFRSNTYGIAQTLTINSAPSLTDADFRDIYVIGTAAPISGTRIGDLRGIRGITADTPKTVYWSSAAGGTWSATNWAATSGGATSNDNFPLAQDTAVIENTGLNTSATVTLNATLPFIGTIDMSTRTNAATIAISSGNVVYGDWVTGSGITYSGGVNLTFSGRNTQTITSAGKQINNVAPIIDSYGGVVQLADAFSSGSGITVTNGTFTTQGYAVTVPSLSSSNSNVRAVNLGSSTVTLSSQLTFTTSTNFSFNAGTSSIVLSASSPTFDGGGLTFYNVSFTSTSTAAGATITGQNTFQNLTCSAPSSAGLRRDTYAANQTITGTLTVSGATAVRRIFVRSDTLGTPRTLTVNSLSADDCDFRDITIAGTAAGSSPTRAGDCGGNNNITFPSPKTVYWNLAGSQVWGATAWATSSGGTPNINNYPLPQDTAVLDDAGSITGTITITGGAYQIGTLDMSGRTSAATVGINAVTVYGNFLFGSGITTSGTQAITFSGRGTQTITSAGKSFTNNLTIDSFSGTAQLADALALGSARTLSLTSGTFDAVTYNVTTGNLLAIAGAAIALRMGSGTWTLSGTGTPWNVASDIRFSKGTANIVLSDTSTTARTFTGAGLSYNKLTIGGATGTSTLTISGNNQFTELASTKTVAHTIALGVTSQTLGAWTVTGTAGNVVTVTGTAILTIAGARVSGVDYLAMGTNTVSSASPGEFYAGANSTGSGAGVILTAAPAPVTRYWRGGTGTWDATTTTNWSATSGGAGGASVPTSADAVVFDSASNATAYTVTCTATQLRCASLTMSNPASGLITWAGTAPLAIHGSASFPTGTYTRTYTGAITLTGSSTGNTFATNGTALSSVITVNGVGCEWALNTALVSTGTSFFVTNGTFSTNNYNMTVGSLQSANSNTRTINLGSSSVSLNATGTSTVNLLPVTNLTFNAGTSVIRLISTTSMGLATGGVTFYNVLTTGTSITTFTISGKNTFNILEVTGRASAGISAVQITADQTIDQFVLDAGSDGTCRTFVQSNTIGTTRTLTCAAVDLTDIDFRDIAIAGAAAPVSGTRLGDCKGNSGITFDAAKTVYWGVTSNANWGASSATWSATNGGATSHANFPLAQDTAVFPSAYPNGGGSVTIQAAYNIGTIDMSARTAITMILSTGSQTPAIYGNWINGTGTTLTGTGTLTFAGRGSQTITSAGRGFTQQITVDSPSGSVTLQDAISWSNANGLTLNKGVFDANTYNLTTSGGILSTSNTTRTLSLGSGTWALTGSGGIWSVSSTNLTVTGTGTISLTSASAKTFAGGGISYSGITLNQGGAGTLTITGNNTFANISNTYKATGATTIAMGTTTQTVGNFTASGEAGRVLTVQGTSASSPATLIFSGTGQAANVDYLSIVGVRAYGLVDTWYAGANSSNFGSLGWYFEAGASTAISVFIVESATANTAESATGAFTTAVSETVSGSDAAAAGMTFLGTLNESATASDVVAVITLYLRDISESTRASDLVAATANFARSVTELTQASETAASTKTMPAAIAETVRPTDTINAGLLYLSSISEATTASEIAAAARAFSSAIMEATSASEVAVAQALFLAAVPESVSGADIVAAFSSYNGSIAELATAADAARRAKVKFVDLENYVATGADVTAMTAEATVTGNTASGTVESGQITATVLP